MCVGFLRPLQSQMEADGVCEVQYLWAEHPDTTTQDFCFCVIKGKKDNPMT